MSKTIEEKLTKIPIINIVVRLFKKIKLPTLEGLSLYDLLEMYILGIVKGALTSRAGAIAFSFFMAIFPTLLFLLNLLPYIPIEGFQEDFMVRITSLLPDETAAFFETIIEDILKNRRGGLLSSTFFLSIFLMANGVNAIFGGFENSYHAENQRRFYKQYLYALSVGLILSLLLIFTIIAIGYLEIHVFDYVNELTNETMGSDLDKVSQIGVSISSFLFFTIMIYISTSVLYYFGTTQGKEAKFFSTGALFTTVLILLTSYLFGIYIANFSHYNQLYGSIGTILILMFYIWINSTILLLGYELNASISKLRKQRQR